MSVGTKGDYTMGHTIEGGRSKRQVPFSFYYEEPTEKKQRLYLNRGEIIPKGTTRKPKTKTTTRVIKSRAIKKNKIHKQFFNKENNKWTWFGRHPKDGPDNKYSIETQLPYKKMKNYDNHIDDLQFYYPREGSLNDINDISTINKEEMISSVTRAASVALRPVSTKAANITVTEYGKMNSKIDDTLLKKVENTFFSDIKSEIQRVASEYFIKRINQFNNSEQSVNIPDSKLRNNKILRNKFILISVPIEIPLGNSMESRRFPLMFNTPIKEILESMANYVAGAAAKTFERTVNNQVTEDFIEKEFEKMRDNIKNDILDMSSTMINTNNNNQPDLDDDIQEYLKELGVIIEGMSSSSIRIASQMYIQVIGQRSRFADNAIKVVTKRIFSKIVLENMKDLVTNQVITAIKKGINESGNDWEDNTALVADILKPAKAFLIKHLTDATEKVALAAAKNVIDNIIQDSLKTKIQEIIKISVGKGSLRGQQLKSKTRKMISDSNKSPSPLDLWLDITLQYLVINSAESIKNKLTIEDKYKNFIHKQIYKWTDAAVVRTLENKDSSDDLLFMKKAVETVTDSVVAIFKNEIDGHIYNKEHDFEENQAQVDGENKPHIDEPQTQKSYLGCDGLTQSRKRNTYL